VHNGEGQANFMENIPWASKEQFLSYLPRPSCAIDEEGAPVRMQIIDVSYEMQPTQGDPEPVMLVFGTDEGGASVLARVHGFYPYFYCPLPRGFDEAHLPQLRDALELSIQHRMPAKDRGFAQIVRAIEHCMRQSIMHFSTEQTPFARITLATPAAVSVARAVLAEPLLVAGHPVGPCGTYESNLPFVMRFMIDRRIVGAGWAELRDAQPAACAGGTTRVLAVHSDDVVALPPAGEWLKMAPLRLLSFDIECAAQKGRFPDATLDPVIQIATIVTCGGETLLRTVFTLQGCTPIVGAEVRCFRDEPELLLAWRNLVVAADPDILTGYNIVNFDLPYLLRRAEHLRVGKQFATFGRMLGARPVACKEANFSSMQTGKRESKEITVLGRVIFDAFQVVQRDYKLRSYSLNAVSAHFLKQQKEDVHHSIISTLQAGTNDDRRRLAVYCLKDAALPLQLLDKLMSLVNYIEMARVTGVPLGYLLTRGQQVKVLSCIYREANPQGVVIPAKERAPSVQTNADGKGYEGAVVIDPLRGFYAQPIATLDFASLYPSIMMAHNLCYTTLVPPAQRARVMAEHGEDALTRTPNGDVFVKPSVRMGILPRILYDLIAARKQAKVDMARESDPFRKKVFDGRQLALKVVCNSVYGFTGAQVGQIPCLEISASVTSFGREMIMRTRQGVLDRYCRANGYAHDSLVVYGDTDSVMVRFGIETVAEAMVLGKEAADYVSTFFLPPIKLEFEKVYCPYLLLNKKRYAGMYWTKPDKPDYMDKKGVESVRRDNCPLVKEVVDGSLRRILLERSPDSAIAFVKGLIAELLQNKMDISMLVITKGLTKSADEYKGGVQAHVALAERMRKRDPGSAPHVGDRVPFVIVQGPKGARAADKCEDPLYVLEHGLPLDANYYLENQLRGPITRIFEPLVPDIESIFRGEHTRHVVLTAPCAAALGGFALRRKTCVGCRVPLAGDGALCRACAPMQAEILMRAQMRVRHLESEFAAAWTQCQRCQGSMHQEVICSNRDCPIFYARRKVQSELKGAAETVQRFDDW
jgi:DNA polymerase delta subunit 1